jgi:hypothetical protein
VSKTASVGIDGCGAAAGAVMAAPRIYRGRRLAAVQRVGRSPAFRRFRQKGILYPVMGVNPVSVVLWVFALAAMIWILVPPIAFALGFGGLRTETLPDVGPPPVAGQDAAVEARLNQLEALGFRDAGRTREIAWFMSPLHWRWTSLAARWLVSPDRVTHAVLYRLVADERPRIACFTLMGDDGIVCTSCPGVGMHSWSAPLPPRYRRTEMAGIDAAALLDEHARQVATFAAENSVNARASRVAEISAATNAIERPLIRKIGNSSYGMLVVLSPALFFLSAALFSTHRTTPMLPASICGLAAFYGLLRWVVLGPLRRNAFMRSHLTAQEAAKADEDDRVRTIEKYARPLRVLAGACALLTAALIGLHLSCVRAGTEQFGQLLVVPLLFAAWAATVLIGRMRGRPTKSGRSATGVWLCLMFTAMWLSPNAHLSGGAHASLIAGLCTLLPPLGFFGLVLDHSAG